MENPWKSILLKWMRTGVITSILGNLRISGVNWWFEMRRCTCQHDLRHAKNGWRFKIMNNFGNNLERTPCFLIVKCKVVPQFVPLNNSGNGCGWVWSSFLDDLGYPHDLGNLHVYRPHQPWKSTSFSSFRCRSCSAFRRSAWYPARAGDNDRPGKLRQ